MVFREFSDRAENQFGSIFRYLFMNLPARVGSESISGDDEDIKSCYRFARIFARCISFGPFRYLRVKVRNIGIELFNQLTPPSAVSTSSTEEYTACIKSLIHVDFHSNPFRYLYFSKSLFYLFPYYFQIFSELANLLFLLFQI